MLALIALLGLKPWAADSVEPRLQLPVFEAAVGESIAFPPERGAFVADAAVAPSGAKQVKAAAERPSEAEGPSTALAVAPARLVAVAEVPSSPAPEPAEPGNEVPSDGATDVEAPPEGTSLPVSAPETPDGGGPGPVPSRGPVLESCEGDEYVITIVLVPGAGESEEVEASVEIVLRLFNADGSVEELQLEGSTLDAENLALQLSSEGNCVYLEADAGGAEEAPSDGTSQAVVPSEGASSAIPSSP